MSGGKLTLRVNQTDMYQDDELRLRNKDLSEIKQSIGDGESSINKAHRKALAIDKFKTEIVGKGDKQKKK